MVHVSQIVLGLLAASSPQPKAYNAPTNQPLRSTSSKNIAVIGAGTSGLATLNTLLQYKETHQTDWTITVFEQRHDVGGVWLPNEYISKPPKIPMTPLYPRLRTNLPVPSMTYPGPSNTFPEGTPLYPPAHHVEEYERDYARRHGLYQYIKLNHTVTSTHWIGNATTGHWGITYTASDTTVKYGHFDHLVVAAGFNHFPHTPSWPGQDFWLANKRHREITHSLWFHLPEEYKGFKVLVVGAGSSGKDITAQLAAVCEVHLSVRGRLKHSIDPRVIIRPEIVHFTRDTIVFSDNTTYDADIVMLCTGYDLRYPFLEGNGVLPIDPGSSLPSVGLKSNLRYIYPLHDHIFSLDPTYPMTALSFIGLPIYVPKSACAIAQSIYLAHIIAKPDVLESREVLLRRLADQQQDSRKQGYDPYYIGHRFLNDSSFDYLESLVDYLKRKGALPRNGQKFVEDWRREVPGLKYLQQGWMRVERLGLESEWLSGVSNESEWVTMMRRLDAWEQELERLPVGIIP